MIIKTGEEDKMFPVKEFEKRFREILAQLDEFRNVDDDDQADEIEELNAEFEDALFVVECIDPNEEEWEEEFNDALLEFKDLMESYEKLAEEIPDMSEPVQRLRMTVQMAESNLKL